MVPMRVGLGLVAISLVISVGIAGLVLANRAPAVAAAPVPAPQAPVWRELSDDAKSAQFVSKKIPSEASHPRFWMASVYKRPEPVSVDGQVINAVIKKILVEADCDNSRVRMLQTYAEEGSGLSRSTGAWDPPWVFIDPDDPLWIALDIQCWNQPAHGRGYDSLAAAATALRPASANSQQ